MGRTTRKRSQKTPKRQRLALYHDMHVEEGFESCATRIFAITRKACTDFPSAERVMCLDIQGHRNSAGGYDHDAYELMTEFLLGFLMPYLTEVHTPLVAARNTKPQREDLPDELIIRHEDDSLQFDHQALAARSREDSPVERATRPSVRAIAEYLGMSPACIICWKTPVERAHVVPVALGGSNDVRNFALLCREHHAEAPDVADAESFWSWVDYAYDRDHQQRLSGISTEQLAVPGIAVVEAAPATSPTILTGHFAKIRAELQQHYGWSAADFVVFENWGQLMDEYHEVMGRATSKHFGIDSKTSTEAWAFDIARRRLTGSSPGAKSQWCRTTGEQDSDGHTEQ